MSKPRYYWYDISKKMINRYTELNPRCDIENRFIKAINKCMQDAQSYSNGSDRVKAIQMVLIDKTHTSGGAALNLHYSERNIQYWINDFVNAVGKEAGFEWQKKNSK